jgi:GSH-dependent disulfide-bond oxidoreductase
MFQMGGLGPMLGQAHHFRIYAPEKIDYAVNRYTNEANDCMASWIVN